MRCIELVPDMSKAYQLAGEALVKAGDTERAKSVLRQGYTIAAGKGDFMPKSAMAKALGDLGEPIADAPTPSAAAAVDQSGPVPEGMIRCRQSGRIGTKFVRPPFRGKLGEWIAANISKETFDAWIRQGTKVINEMRLDLSRERDQEVYDQHMREYLGVDEKDLA
jgi:Fe-S cluster biosynthesis and repair protein YggX